MATNLESYPFSETPGKEIGHGFMSIVKELGPDWVVKEFNPKKPNGTLKDEGAYESSQNPQYIKELQESQRILNQDFIYGDKLIQTNWVLGRDESGNEKYFTVQKRFKRETLEALRDYERFTTFFGENKELRLQMLELMWGTKRALVETGVPADFHVGNIAVVKEEGSTPKLMIFDLPNMIGFQKTLYGEPPASPERRKFILNNVEKRATRFEEYEKWLEVTEEEKFLLDQKFGIDNSRYSDIMSNLLRMKEQLS